MRISESLNGFQTSGHTDLLLAGAVFELFLKHSGFLIQVHHLQELLDSFRADAGSKIFAIVGSCFLIFGFGQHLLVLKRGFAWVRYHIRGKINNFFKITG